MRNWHHLSIFFLFSMLSCTTQHGSVNKAQPVKLSKEIYKQLLKKGDFSYERNDSVYDFAINDNIVIKHIRAVGKRLNKVQVYHKDNLLLKEEYCKFSKIYIGTLKKYNHSGNLLSVKDYDSDFPFSLNDFISKINDEFGLDLNEERFIVRRFVDEDTPKYRINYDVNIYSYKQIEINGVDGQIMQDTTIVRTE